MTGKYRQRGFSLIEAAIVLAVVGLVLGGIWVAAAAMYENYKVNKTVEGIFSTARNIQNLISIRDAEAFGHPHQLSPIVARRFFCASRRASRPLGSVPAGALPPAPASCGLPARA